MTYIAAMIMFNPTETMNMLAVISAFSNDTLNIVMRIKIFTTAQSFNNLFILFNLIVKEFNCTILQSYEK